MSVLKLFMSAKPIANSLMRGTMTYGKNKADGSHDHRFNTGADRTPAQKKGDASKRSQGDV